MDRGSGALEAGVAGVDVGQGSGAVRRQLILSFFEDDLDRTVAGGVKSQSSGTGGLQSLFAVAVAEPDHALGGTEVVEDPVGEQPLDELQAGHPDLGSLFETPLGIAQLVGQGLRWQVIVQGAVPAAPVQPGVDRDQLMVLEHLDRGVGGLEPEGLANELKGNGVEVLFKGDMGVAVDLDLSPDRQLHRDIGQGGEQFLLRFGKQRQRPAPGGAMDAVAGLGHDPIGQLVVGVGKIAELPQGEKGPFDVLDPGLDPALLLRFPRRAGLDAEAIAQGQFFIGPLHLRVLGAGSGNGAFGVVDDHLFRYAAEPFEGPAVTGQPGLDLLIEDELGVLVAGSTQGHDEEPRGELRSAVVGMNKLGT